VTRLPIPEVMWWVWQKNRKTGQYRPNSKLFRQRPTVHQVAVALNLSDPTVRRRIDDKTLKAYRVGPRAIRVDKASVIKMASQPVAGA
jgi:excisionase family DNA binding protein